MYFSKLAFLLKAPIYLDQKSVNTSMPCSFQNILIMLKFQAQFDVYMKIEITLCLINYYRPISSFAVQNKAVLKNTKDEEAKR